MRVSLLVAYLLTAAVLRATCGVAKKERGRERERGCATIYYPAKHDNQLISNWRHCKAQHGCRKRYKMLLIRINPYYLLHLRKKVYQLLSECCGNCTKVYRSRSDYLADMSHITPSTMKPFPLVFPVLAYSTSVMVYDYYFIPVYEPPGAFYITVKKPFLFRQLLQICIQLWPLVVSCLFMSILSGFIVWILETRSNTAEFPRPFLVGWFDGFWWSFISMTTVGYGDKSPRTFAARIFSVAWIFVGIILFGVLSGSLTTKIMGVRSPATPLMAGKRVGAIRNRIYDEYLISQNGGIPHPSEDKYVWDSYKILELTHKLHTHQISGFLLDKYTFWQITVWVKRIVYSQRQQLKRYERHFLEVNNITTDGNYTKNDLRSIANFFLHNTIQTDVPHLGDKVSYGLLVRRWKDYEYFKDAFKNSKMIFNSFMATSYASKQKVNDEGFKIISDLSKKHLSIIIIILFGMICGFGVIYEVFRRRDEQKAKSLTGKTHSAVLKSGMGGYL